MKKKIVIANDHGATELKVKITKYLETLGYEVINLGSNEGESVDYPDKAIEACNEYLKGQYDFGILCCGTGIGISMSANKVPGIRCALLHNNYTAEMAKNHNNANFIAFGGRIDYSDSVEEMIRTFIETDFGGDRHQRRINKMMEIDNK